MPKTYRDAKEELAAFKAEHPLDNGEVIEDSRRSVISKLKELKAAQEAKSAAEERHAAAQLAVMKVMGDAATLRAGTFEVNFKAFWRKEVVQKAQYIRSLRVTRKTASTGAVKVTRTVKVDGPVVKEEVNTQK